MATMLADFTGLEIFFALCAIAGGAFTLVRLVLQFVGGDSDVGDGGDMDVDLDGADGGDHPDADLGFKVLSLQSLSSFFLMFGLVGLAMTRQSHFGAPVSIAAATLAGMASVWLIGRLFAMFNRLQSSGTLPNSAAKGATGTVYLNIPAGGQGRVTLRVQERLREYDAVTVDGSALPTGTAIEVVAVRDDVMVVTPLN